MERAVTLAMEFEAFKQTRAKKKRMEQNGLFMIQGSNAGRSMAIQKTTGP